MPTPSVARQFGRMRLRAAALLLTLPLLSTAALADSLIDNVDGVTLDADGNVVRFTGLVIDNDGNVKQLLRRGDRRPDRPDFRKDGRGQVLMPGIIDSHGHVMGLGFQQIELDLSGARSLSEAQETIRQWAARNPEERWIVGRGWNQEAWGLGRFPTAAELDAAVSDRPVWLMRVDGHAGWANTQAMTAARVSPTTRAPEGGRIETAAGRPSGVFIDSAMQLIEAHRPQPLARDRDRALALAQRKLLSLGITTTTDMGTSIDDWQAYRRAGDAGLLNVRIISYGAGIDSMALIAGSAPTPWLYQDRLRLVGVKLVLDGALGSRGAWLNAPYSDAPSQRGISMLSDSQLRNRMVRASMDGFQIAVHAIGDAANMEMLSAIDDVSGSFTGDRRWRIEHAQIVTPQDIARFGRNGVIASMQPVHQTSDMHMAEARLGADRLSGAYAWRSILTAGGKLAFGSDYPVESPDPFAGLAVAVSRTDANGQPTGGWHPEQTVTREQALDGFTRGGAYAAFAEDRLGTLMPGHRADFLLVNTDPTRAEAADVRATQVNETWIAGRPAWVRGQNDGAPQLPPRSTAAAPQTAQPATTSQGRSTTATPQQTPTQRPAREGEETLDARRNN